MKPAVVLGWWLLCACAEHGNPPSAPPKELSMTPKTVKVAMFDDVTIADGAIHLMDGGIHGVQGHTLVIPATGEASWERRLDGMQPSGKPGAGKVALTADELGKLRGWADGLWALAPKGKARFDDPTPDVPRWVWAIVLRRGDEVRVLTGGGITPGTNAPEPAKSTLAWLLERVDAAAPP